jgi:lipopolysaccharide biosynthesis protein
MRSICIFCSYYTGNTMPPHVKFYLTELGRHFTKVILVTNEKEMIPADVTFLKSSNIDINLVVNEGYDFGMYYKMLKKYDVRDYDRIGLINDSCILFNKLDPIFEWIDNKKADYYGLTDSYEISYHLQSYFLIINKKAIPLVIDYFNKNGIEEDLTKLVEIYEVGLSTYLSNSGINIKVYHPTEKNRVCNPSYLDAKKLIKKGFPLIKKKIILQEYPIADWKQLIMAGFDPYPMHYIRLIKKITKSSYQHNLFSGFLITKTPWQSFLFTLYYIRMSLFGLLVVVVRKIKKALNINRRKNMVT